MAQAQTYVAGGLQGASAGASAGMVFGPWGAAAGAVIGGVFGAISAGLNQDKERERIEEEKRRALEQARGQYALQISQSDYAYGTGKGNALVQAGRQDLAVDRAVIDLENSTSSSLSYIEALQDRTQTQLEQGGEAVAAQAGEANIALANTGTRNSSMEAEAERRISAMKDDWNGQATQLSMQTESSVSGIYGGLLSGAQQIAGMRNTAQDIRGNYQAGGAAYTSYQNTLTGLNYNMGQTLTNIENQAADAHAAADTSWWDAGAAAIGAVSQVLTAYAKNKDMFKAPDSAPDSPSVSYEFGGTGQNVYNYASGPSAVNSYFNFDIGAGMFDNLNLNKGLSI